MNTSRRDWLDQDAALELLGVSRPTLYRWIKDGRVRAYHAGRALRFDRAELQAFLRGETPPADALSLALTEAFHFFEERARQRAAAARSPATAPAHTTTSARKKASRRARH